MYHVFEQDVPYVFDLSSLHYEVRNYLHEQTGAAFEDRVNRIIDDIYLYIFEGEQYRGEQVLARTFKELMVTPSTIRPYIHRFFTIAYESIGVGNANQLVLMEYNYQLAANRESIMVVRPRITKSRAANPLTSMVDNLEKSITEGAYVPERIRRLLNECQTDFST